MVIADLASFSPYGHIWVAGVRAALHCSRIAEGTRAARAKAAECSLTALTWPRSASCRSTLCAGLMLVDRRPRALTLATLLDGRQGSADYGWGRCRASGCRPHGSARAAQRQACAPQEQEAAHSDRCRSPIAAAEPNILSRQRAKCSMATWTLHYRARSRRTRTLLVLPGWPTCADQSLRLLRGLQRGAASHHSAAPPTVPGHWDHTQRL